MIRPADVFPSVDCHEACPPLAFGFARSTERRPRLDVRTSRSHIARPIRRSANNGPDRLQYAVLTNGRTSRPRIIRLRKPCWILPTLLDFCCLHTPMFANTFTSPRLSSAPVVLRRAAAKVHPSVLVVAALLVSLALASPARAQSSVTDRLRARIQNDVSGLRKPVAGSGFYRARYRPRHGRFRTLPTDRFDLIYPTEMASVVPAFLRALTAHAAATDSMLGHDGSLRLPVILNDRSDIANGYVAYRPLRSEMYTAHPPYALSTGFASWPEAVAPHELVHAVHGDLDSGLGVGGVLGVFAPDASRQLHMVVPRGWTEGIAVYRES